MLITETVSKIGAWNPFSTLSNLINFFKNINEWITNIFSGITSIIFMIPYALFVGFSYILIFCQSVFYKIAGLDNVSVAGKETDNIILSFLFSSEVIRVFISMLVFSVLLLLIFSIIAIVKSEFALDVKNSAKGPIFGRALKALAMFVATPVATIMGIYLVSGITKSLNSMLGADQMGLHSQLFYLGAQSANRIRNNPTFGEYIKGSGNKPTEITSTNIDAIAADIDMYFKNEFTGTMNITGKAWDLHGNNAHVMFTGMPTPDSGTNNKYTFSLTNVRLVMYYYDLAQFNWVLGFGSVLYLAYILLATCIALIKRVFDITILFLISPAMISLYPLDNGDAAKKINKQMITKVISVLVTVFAFNMYFILLPVFQQINLFASTSTSAVISTISGVSTSTFASTGGLIISQTNDVINFALNGIWGVLLICVGASIIKQTSDLVAKAIGAEDLIKSGTDSAKKTVQTVAKTAVAVAVGGAAIGAMLGKGKAGKSMMDKAEREGDDAYSEEFAKSGNISKAESAKAKAKEDSIRDSRKGFRKELFMAMPGFVGGTAKTVSDAKKAIKELDPDKAYNEQFKTEKIKAQVASDNAGKLESYAGNKAAVQASKAKAKEFASVNENDIVGESQYVKNAKSRHNAQKQTVDGLIGAGTDRNNHKKSLQTENRQSKIDINNEKAKLSTATDATVINSINNQISNLQNKIKDNKKIIKDIDLEIKLKADVAQAETEFKNAFADVLKQLNDGNSVEHVSANSSALGKEALAIIDAKSKEANMIRAKIDTLNTELSSLSIEGKGTEVEAKMEKIRKEIERLSKLTTLKK